VRALLGAILEKLGKNQFINQLKEKLNPLTKYKLGISSEKLDTALNWNIV
jgi:hypothetical protein